MSEAGRPEAVIFDFGYVLFLPIDREAWQASLAALAVEHGLEKAGQLWAHIYESDAWERGKRGQITRDEFWADRVGALGVKDEAGVARFRERLFEHVPGIHPAMRLLVENLQPVVRLAIVSNTAVRDMDRWLADEHDMADMFEVVVGSADVGLAKPEPEIYQLALERLDLSPEKTLFIDDTPRNIEAAEALGIPSILFTTPEALSREFQQRGLLGSSIRPQ